jgi:hypothetical protein
MQKKLQSNAVRLSRGQLVALHHRPVAQVDVLNLHSFSTKKMTTADGWNPSLQGITSQKKMVTILENRLNKLRIRLSEYDHENSQVGEAATGERERPPSR